MNQSKERTIPLEQIWAAVRGNVLGYRLGIFRNPGVDLKNNAAFRQFIFREVQRQFPDEPPNCCWR